MANQELVEKLKAVREQLLPVLSFVDEELARASDASAAVLVGHERWTQEEVTTLVDRTLHLPAAKELFALTSAAPGEQVSYETLLEAVAHENPRQTQNELSALTRHVRKLRGSVAWPLFVEGGPPIRYRAEEPVASWIRAALHERGVQMRSDRFAYNMAGWAFEKMDHVVRALAELVDALRGSKTEASEKALSFVAEALWDATKVLSFVAEAEWSPADRDLVLQEGVRGYEQLAARWKLA